MAEAKIAGYTTTTTIKTQFSHCRASKHLQPLLPSHANPQPPNESPPARLNEIFGMGPPPGQSKMVDAPDQSEKGGPKPDPTAAPSPFLTPHPLTIYSYLNTCCGGVVGGCGGAVEGLCRALDLDLVADLKAHGLTGGGCSKVSPATLHIGRPCHMRCTPQDLHRTFPSGAPGLQALQGHVWLGPRDAPGTGLWRGGGGAVEGLWRGGGGAAEGLWRGCEGVVEGPWRGRGGVVEVWRGGGGVVEEL